jgi:membrane associated rhomboid family serine protease
MRPPDSWAGARVTLAIAIVTAAAWLLAAALGRDEWAAMWGGFIPARVGETVSGTLVPVWLTPLSAALIHGGLLHLLFNLVILVFCGRPTENLLGPLNFAILYLAGAYAAAAAQYAIDPSSSLPMIGASGAISAVLGAYAFLFGRNKVKVSNRTLAMLLNALWLLAAWVALNLIVALTLLNAGIAVAWAAHIGGFALGLLLVKPLFEIRYRNA